MTTINKNGQLEWTFEELDLEGAWEEQVELDNKLVGIYRYLVDEYSLTDKDLYRDYLNIKINEVRKKVNVSSTIRKYLRNLKWGYKFNEK